jgi:hypothetical protein
METKNYGYGVGKLSSSYTPTSNGPSSYSNGGGGGQYERSSKDGYSY